MHCSASETQAPQSPCDNCQSFSGRFGCPHPVCASVAAARLRRLAGRQLRSQAFITAEKEVALQQTVTLNGLCHVGIILGQAFSSKQTGLSWCLTWPNGAEANSASSIAACILW